MNNINERFVEIQMRTAISALAVMFAVVAGGFVAVAQEAKTADKTIVEIASGNKDFFDPRSCGQGCWLGRNPERQGQSDGVCTNQCSFRKAA